MANYNRVILMGNLTRDPQLSYTPSNTAVTDFGLAVNHKWRGQDGQNKEETCFVDCSLFGKGAETFNQYMSKGRSVLVEGRLRYSQWETPEGQKRSRLTVVADRFQFVGGRDGGGGGGYGGGGYGGGQQGERSQAPAQAPQQQPSEQPSQPDEGQPAQPQGDQPPPPSDDDIPF